MSAQQWMSALMQQEETFPLRFERLGIEAQCRPLTSGEVEECVRMGGEKGLRYALYLSCKELREAGESLRKQGSIGSAFDITQRLTYGDVTAAGAIILARSGVDSDRVTAGEEDSLQRGQAFAARMLEGEEDPALFARSWPKTGEMAGESPLFPAKNDDWALADRLMAARGNR